MLNKVRFDWFSFTIKNKEVLEVMRDLGCDFENYTSKPFGRFGYNSMVAHDVYPITFLFDGTADMGVHCTVGGSAIRHFFEMYLKNCPDAQDTPWGYAVCGGVVEHFTRYVLKHGKFSRVDVNIDTDMEEMNPVAIFSHIQDGQMISKYRSWKLINASDGSATLYIGKRTSSSMIRLYDKAKEQSDYDSRLYRFEVQFNSYADSFMKMFLEFGLGATFYSFVRGAIRFTDEKKAYDCCEYAFYWQEFMELIQCGGDVEFIHYEEKQNKTSVASLYHMFNQYGNVIADFLENFGDCDEFFEFMYTMLSDNYEKTKTNEYLNKKGWWI